MNSITAFVLLLAMAAKCASLTHSPMQMSASSHNEIRGDRRSFVSQGGTAALSAIGLTAFTPQTAKATALPPTDTKAPQFELPNSQREGTTSLLSLTKSGKWTVLYFYPGAFTQGCTLEARGFQRDIDQYRALGTQIVGVSVDSIEKNAKFCSSEGLDFYMLTDEGGRVSQLYGSSLTVPGFGTFSNRQTYIIDDMGNLRWIFTDVESRVAKHSSEVLEKLRELKTA
eukprot:CAMPEP_0185730318 /NCGR_PEP_ID=MMETSP1171-20130828/9461_1 /TAXON_ID=374046 /ORGANISM="Helicotheca tamensis, Strain CCMP826" /LENGTH=226 /DNA_ID=CAMNT_0028399339 /DNA_START=21 /DNA_END=701 /DNA_ORIENTATION=-